jgi:putative ABC transport system permease protein
MPDLRFDIRMAARALRAAPMVTLLALLCTGLGIGAVTTVYSTASAFTFHPLPQLVDADRLLIVGDSPAKAPTANALIAPGTFTDVALLPEFSVVGAVTGFPANIAGDDLPERVGGERVSAGFFRMARRAPLLGRTFLPEESQPGADRVVVLSYGLWQRRFGGDPAIVDRNVRINGEAWKVVGVMPHDFVFPAGTQLWVPLALSPAEAADRTSRNLIMMGRLAPGVTAERGALAVSALGTRLAADWPDAYKDRVLRAQRAEEVFGEGPRPFMIVLIGAVAFQLLIACANVANLLLARATGRRRETGVRIALGASRRRLIGQYLTESLMLALGGGVLGVLLARWGVWATGVTVPVEVQQYIPGFGAVHLDARAFVVAAVVSMLAGVVFGIAPALAGSRVDVVTSLKDAGRGESRRSGLRRLRSSLVVGEIAMALILLAGAALMVTTFRRLSVSDPGFRMKQVLTATVTLPRPDYPTDSAVVQFWDRLRQATAALPGVDAAELTSVLPMSWNEQRGQFYVDHERPERLEDLAASGVRRVSAGLLSALDVKLIRGRLFASSDAQDAHDVAILSARAASRYFPGGDALGRRIVWHDRPLEVVGIVHDVRANPLTSDEPRDVVYVPMTQWIVRTASLVVCTRQDPASITRALQTTIGRLDARLAAGDVAPMERVVATVTSPQSATAQMLTASALIALIMATIGTYGVMSYVVGRRAHEMGVRVALGARRADIVRLIVGSVARLIVPGIVLGVLGALALGRGIQAILVDTSSSDPVVLGGAALLLGLIALAAGYFPARRAAAVSPLVALRSD